MNNAKLTRNKGVGEFMRKFTWTMHQWRFLVMVSRNFLKVPAITAITNQQVAARWCCSGVEAVLAEVSPWTMGLRKIGFNTAMRRWGWVKTLVPLVNIKIAGKCMFIPLKMVSIGIDPYPDLLRCAKMQTGWWFTYPSEKYESQLGWLFHSRMGSHKIHVPNHQPMIINHH